MHVCKDERESFYCTMENIIGNPSWMEWRVCGEKAQKGLANGSFMYFFGQSGRREIE